MNDNRFNRFLTTIHCGLAGSVVGAFAAPDALVNEYALAGMALAMFLYGTSCLAGGRIGDARTDRATPTDDEERR